MSEHWECIIVGGGAAGLSTAVVLGRARGDVGVGMPSVAKAISEVSNAAQAVVRSLLVDDHRLPPNG